ncbi:MAG: hypothetical protein IPP67_07135 [Rhodospirillaceae bacterium]|nr:hypothetical protein [Rhodospirillaceae bacterium]
MMGTWLPTSGYLPDDKRPCLEIYLNTPMSTPEPELDGYLHSHPKNSLKK